MATPRQVRLPRQWAKHVKSGVLHAISLASVVLAYTRSRASGYRRLQAELDQAQAEIALLREELRIKDGRWERSRTRRRPRYTPTQRMRILQLRAARGWNLKETARVFLIDLQTLMIWMRPQFGRKTHFLAVLGSDLLLPEEPRLRVGVDRRRRQLHAAPANHRLRTI